VVGLRAVYSPNLSCSEWACAMSIGSMSFAGNLDGSGTCGPVPCVRLPPPSIQQSSMLRNTYPLSRRPELTMSAAVCRSTDASKSQRKEFHVLNPIGGVAAMSADQLLLVAASRARDVATAVSCAAGIASPRAAGPSLLSPCLEPVIQGAGAPGPQPPGPRVCTRATAGGARPRHSSGDFNATDECRTAACQCQTGREAGAPSQMRPDHPVPVRGGAGGWACGSRLARRAGRGRAAARGLAYCRFA
jgi:hypothetical protein